MYMHMYMHMYMWIVDSSAINTKYTTASLNTTIEYSPRSAAAHARASSHVASRLFDRRETRH